MTGDFFVSTKFSNAYSRYKYLWVLTSEALVLLAEQVLNRDLDILKGDVSGAGRPDTLAVHTASRDTGAALNEQQRNAVHARAASPHGSGEVVGPDTVGDPLLLAVDDEVLAILAQLGLAGEVGNVGAGIGLGDGQADALVAAQDARAEALLESLGAKLEEWRAADTETSNQVPDEAARAGPGQLVGHNQLVEEIPLLRGDGLYACGHEVGRVLDAQQTGQVASATHLLVNLLGNTLRLIPLGHMRLDIGLNPLTQLSAQGRVGLVEVGGVVVLVPAGVGEGDLVAESLERLRVLLAVAAAT